MAKTAAALAWQIHDLISFPDLLVYSTGGGATPQAGSRFVSRWRVYPDEMGQSTVSCPKSHAWSRRSHALGVIRTKT
jgi:hypothetical protein